MVISWIRISIKIINSFIKEDGDGSKQKRIDALKKLGSGPPPITVLPSRSSIYYLFVNLAHTRPDDLLSINQTFSMAHNEHEEDPYLLADLMVDYYNDMQEAKKWEVIKYLTHKIPSNFLFKLLRESSKEDRINRLYLMEGRTERGIVAEWLKAFVCKTNGLTHPRFES